MTRISCAFRSPIGRMLCVAVVSNLSSFLNVQVNDPRQKEAMEAQIRHFGQTPSQLLSEPHPVRLPPEVSDVHVRSEFITAADEFRSFQ